MSKQAELGIILVLSRAFRHVDKTSIENEIDTEFLFAVCKIDPSKLAYGVRYLRRPKVTGLKLGRKVKDGSTCLPASWVQAAMTWSCSIRDAKYRRQN